MDVVVEAVDSTSLKVTWKSPDDPNGIITGYRVFQTLVINDREENVNNPVTVSTTISDNFIFNCTIENLGESSK